METKNQNLNGSLLDEFLKELVNIPVLMTEALLKNSSDEDEKNIITSLAPTLKIQFQELSNSIQDLASKSSKQGVAEMNQILKSSAAMDITKSFKMALPSIGSLFGKFGIQEIIFAIKKIIRALFGDKIPKWLDTILNIIDEILNMLKGGDSPKTKNMLSMAEQNFLREITLVEKLNKVRFSSENDEEED